MRLRLRIRRGARTNGERGAAVVEYALLMGAIAAMSMGSLQLITQHVAADFDDIVTIVQGMSEVDGETAAVAAPAPTGTSDDGGSGESGAGEESAPPAGSGVYDDGDRTCPNGWRLVPNNASKKNGQDVDANGDGLICQKDIPGKGKGNTNQNTNVKDNNGK